MILEPISRRTFLRGVGTVMALPMLEAMLPLTALAQTADKMRPNRMAFIFVPNGINMKEWCERGAQAGNCDSGYSCAYSSAISWRSDSTPVAKEIDPRLVFERLFSNGDPAESAESRQRRKLYRKSILDFVMDDAGRLKTQLG